MSIEIGEIMYQQAKLMRSMGWPAGEPTAEGNQEAAKAHLLATMVECTEALGELNWKPWKNYTTEVDKEKFATELMDIMQFVCNAALVMNIDDYDLEQAIRNKWKENYRRIDEGEVTSAK